MEYKRHKMMKIVMTLPAPRLGGGETHQLSLCASLPFWTRRHHSYPLEILQTSKKHIHPSAPPRNMIMRAGPAPAACEARLAIPCIACQHDYAWSSTSCEGQDTHLHVPRVSINKLRAFALRGDALENSYTSSRAIHRYATRQQ